MTPAQFLSHVLEVVPDRWLEYFDIGYLHT